MDMNQTIFSILLCGWVTFSEEVSDRLAFDGWLSSFGFKEYG